MRRVILSLVGLLLSAACSSPAPRFSVENARAHVQMLAGTIGSRPVGSEANRQARDYVVARLREYGFDVRVQQADAERRGATTHVFNVIATKPGRRAQVIALVAHYDSVPDGPGAADDGLGVAVCLEAGRVLAERPNPNYALAVILTDGEEVGLMGASAVMKDPITGWIRAVVNFEAVGSGRPSVLFETSPGSRPLLDAWARSSAPAGDSYMADIYRRLPNDTDFSVFRRAQVAGVNFAAVGDSYSYHTALDTPARLDPRLLLETGEDTVETVAALDQADEIAERGGSAPLYFDVLDAWAVTYSTGTALILFAAALLAALFGWLTVLPVAREAGGHRPVLLLTALWTLVGLVVLFAAMLGAAWLLRATRESYQPWYAHPDRFFVYLALAAILGGWALVRVGRLFPLRMRGSTQPAVAWAIILPFWVAVAVAAQIFAPSASYVAVVPLLAAGVALTVLPLRRKSGMRIASAVVLGVAAVLWIDNGLILLHFAVAVFGRLSVVTPIYVYPALLLLLGLFVVPPALAMIGSVDWRVSGRNRRGDKSWIVDVSGAAPLLLIALFVFAAAWCWFAPAYTEDRPLHGSICYVNDAVAGRARWQIASNEPGAHVGVNAPLAGGWQAGAPPASFGIPVRMALGPFAMYGAAAQAEPAPLTVAGSLGRDQDGAFIEIRAIPAEPALAMDFNLPAGMVPEKTNLAGRQQEGSGFVARYIAVPREGVTLRATITAEDAQRLESGGPDARATIVVMRQGLPGAAWPQLPGWLPRQHVTWHARSYFAIPVPLVAVER